MTRSPLQKSDSDLYKQEEEEEKTVAEFRKRDPPRNAEETNQRKGKEIIRIHHLLQKMMQFRCRLSVFCAELMSMASSSDSTQIQGFLFCGGHLQSTSMPFR
ncbi:uncharacterized protein G2W53_036372 [Senna tora]|uniref:Uncharacterized protein n=1 Tax=Senna tora TaxID=362788 RepID=A0A834WA66_9FABA|nr:uncharacterized protein G2W53_036372 [Senna tora]